jgi:HK97 family phage prohead protease
METVRDLDVVRGISGQVVTVRAKKADAQPEEKAEGDGRLDTVEIRFSPYNVWYRIDSMWEGTFMERTSPGAFAKTIKESRSTQVLFDHGHDPQIGAKVLGPVESLSEEKDSPVGVVPLLDTSYNRDLLPGIRAGLYGSSFRMRVIKDEWNDEPGRSAWNEDGIPERTIKEVRMFEFGPTPFPANPEATTGVRSLTDVWFELERDRDASRYTRLLEEVRSVRTGWPEAARSALPGTPATNHTKDEPDTDPLAGATYAQRAFLLRGFALRS